MPLSKFSVQNCWEFYVPYELNLLFLLFCPFCFVTYLSLAVPFGSSGFLMCLRVQLLGHPLSALQVEYLSQYLSDPLKMSL